MATDRRIEQDRLITDSLEFFLADTCNLACEHCTNSAPYLTDANFPRLDEFRRSLELLRRVMRCRQIKFLGGEPLLNPRLRDFLAAARESAMFDAIRVTTNGLLLERAGDEFWRQVDVVEVSQYPSGAASLTKAALSRSRERAARAGARLEVVEKSAFFAAVLDEPLPDEAAIERVYADCAEAHRWSCHTLYGGRLYRCSRVHTLDRRLSARAVPHAPFTETDGLPVDERLTAENLRTYLESSAPLAACRFCLGTSGRRFRHQQLDRRAPGGLPKVAFEASLLPAPALWRRLGRRFLRRSRLG